MVKLVVGLGNPGVQYLLTRHNVGFMVIDLLAQIWRVKLNGSKNHSIYGIGPGEVYLVKPQTHMNSSGLAVKEWLDDGFRAQEMLVIHDDIDLSFGEVRIKVGGGTAGHKGLNSIVEEIGEYEFPRVRVGVGRPKGREHDHQAIVDYLLSPFTPEEKEELVSIINLGADMVETILRKGMDKALAKEWRLERRG